MKYDLSGLIINLRDGEIWARVTPYFDEDYGGYCKKLMLSLNFAMEIKMELL